LAWQVCSLRVPLSGIFASVGISFPVRCSVAVGTKGHKVLFCVSAELAARFKMMDLQTFAASAGLAAPTIAA
jgi:hypothetical protein